jgi:hypothetical protein
MPSPTVVAIVGLVLLLASGALIFLAQPWYLDEDLDQGLLRWLNRLSVAAMVLGIAMLIGALGLLGFRRE